MKYLGRLAVTILMFALMATIGHGATITVKTASSTSTYATPTWDTSVQKDVEPLGPLLGFIDSLGIYQFVTASHPLPISAEFTIGTLSIPIGAPPDTSTTDLLSATSVSATITPLADRLDITICNIGTTTIWVNIGGAVATVSAGIPVYAGGYISRELDDSVSVSYVASATTPFTCHQAGY